jgi:hypothetical protein
MIHKLAVRKQFRIKNRQGNLITLPVEYVIQGHARSYTKALVELMDIVVEADADKIEETTIIKEVPCSFVNFLDE